MAESHDELLGRYLVQQGIIDAETFEEAKSQVKPGGANLTQVLLGSGRITAQDLARAAENVPLADEPPEPAHEPPTAPPRPSAAPAAPRARPAGAAGDSAKQSLANYEVDPEALRDVPRSVAEKNLVLPLQISQDRVLVAMADATDVFAMDEVRSRTGRRVEPVEVDEEELRRAIETYYVNRARSQVNVTAGTVNISESLGGSEALSGFDDALAKMIDQAPVVRIVEQILRDAVRSRASDVHIEPRGEDVAVRFRVDGKLQVITTLPADMHRYVLSRIKILAGEDIAETRIPQDGRFATVVDDRPIDLRVSTLPTFWGEKAVMRILDKSRTLVSLTQLGFLPDMLKVYEQLINMPQGMLLVTGPTGSGKTTTLYASLHSVNDETKNITTVEDPIEYEVMGLNQVQVNPSIDMTFASALRSILRQDPDVILVGEMRDQETAEMGFRASLTGHLVLSTLHTNDAPSAAIRLADMGIAPYLVASSLIGILAQRLVRQLCTHCRMESEPTTTEIERLQLSAEQAGRIRFHRSRGCTHCRNTGFSGRIALYELMTINGEIREAIACGANSSQLRQVALKNGMKSLKFDGLSKIHQGTTSASEVISVLFAADTLG